jgi:hypothetical protein
VNLRPAPEGLARDWRMADPACRYFVMQLAESGLTPRLFGQILGRIERLAWHPTIGLHTRREHQKSADGLGGVPGTS